MDKMGRLLLCQQNSTHPTNQHCWKLYNFSYWINLGVRDEGSKQNGCLPLKIEKPSYSYECTKITKYNTNIAFFGHNNKIHNSAENKRTKANYLNQKPKRLGERATVVLSEHQVLQSQKYHKIKPVWRSQKTSGKTKKIWCWKSKETKEKKNIVLCWAEIPYGESGRLTCTPKKITSPISTKLMKKIDWEKLNQTFHRMRQTKY